MKKTYCAASIVILLFTAIMSAYLPVRVGAQVNFWKIPLNVSAETADISAGTPVIIKLESLAAAMPTEVDTFGDGTTAMEGDDVDWNALYLFLEDIRIPHQIDDVDGEPGFSSGDEFVFQTPSTIIAGSAKIFSLYFTTKAAELPAPSYPLVNTVTPYPLKDYLNTVFAGPTIGESYVMQNGNVSAVVLVEGAWMSSCIYQLIINETGFDIVKQELDVTILMEPYKWTRFAMPGDLGWIENNPNPTSGMFETRFIKSGPVRCIVKMRSTASYNAQPNIYAVVTYTLYANQSWLDYKLDITGGGVTQGMTLDVNFVNREWAGVPGAIYDTVHVPGKGDLARLPDAKIDVNVDEISEAWYIIYDKAQGKGFGMSFDMEGLAMIAWSRYTEGVAVLYGNPSERLAVDKWSGPKMDDVGMKFPFHARYFPIDSSVTTLAPEEYMSIAHAGWLAKPVVNVQQAEETTLPFNYIRVAVPVVAYDIETKRMSVVEITGNCSFHGAIDDTNADVAKFVVYTSLGLPTGIEGNLTWTGSDWQALDVDLSSLPEGLYYAQCFFKDVDAEGLSEPSRYIGEFVDEEGPAIQDLSWSPLSPTDEDNVTVTVGVTDISGVKEVILSYFDGSQWANITMVKTQDTYAGVIPKASGGVTVEFKIYAKDNAGNWKESSPYSYTVQITTIPTNIVIGAVLIAAILAAVIGFAYYTKRVHKREYKPVVD